MTNAWPMIDQCAELLAGVEMLRQAADQVRAAPTAHLIREQRMDLKRRVEALTRAAEVAAEHLRQPPGGTTCGPRVLIAHRQAWFGEALAGCLERRGIKVVAVTDGADAVGLAVAAQPDVVVIEAVLSRMSGIEVLRDLLTFAPDVRTVVRVAHSNGAPAMLEAGAAAVWVQAVKPEQVAADIAQLVTATRRKRAPATPAGSGQVDRASVPTS